MPESSEDKATFATRKGTQQKPNVPFLQSLEYSFSKHTHSRVDMTAEDVLLCKVLDGMVTPNVGVKLKTLMDVPTGRAS